MVEGSVSHARNPNNPLFADEADGYYDEPTDTYRAGRYFVRFY